MGLGTFLIGLLPTYQQIGVAAPVLLVVLRFLQGIGLGGEWGGAVLMVVENAPKHRRGLFGSMVQVSNPIGSGGDRHVRAGVAAAGERIHGVGMAHSVLISVLLVGVGLWIRLRMEETPAFRQIKARNEVAKMPVLDVFKYPRRPFSPRCA
jgi:MHS family shikimate/dehydroshikimate transporter-like MFS transporter